VCSPNGRICDSIDHNVSVFYGTAWCDHRSDTRRKPLLRCQHRASHFCPVGDPARQIFLIHGAQRLWYERLRHGIITLLLTRLPPGLFYAGYGALLMPFFGVLESYGGDTPEHHNAFGFFLLGTFGLTIQKIVTNMFQGELASTCCSFWRLYQRKFQFPSWFHCRPALILSKKFGLYHHVVRCRVLFCFPCGISFRAS
jgi:hypothetical protein